ncbi:hypothetical protein [Microcella humidisoli]|uniref:Polyketide cyclase / dehydrase and lipid transport n=1 Tax=Microcella humidisoli TaxID=2963406 RepID=A0ABY5FVY0_9MICO|nr:hypothetical protein [Microcella humidisoli]UTT62455.1 hypothetical protein NNL39_12495 [Microcella humidisoli]
MPTVSVSRSTVPADLEYTADALVGAYAPVRSWAHLDALAGRVDSLDWRWVVVQRRDDLGQRFAQCLRAGEGFIVEVGALAPSRGRHTVWRLHAGAAGRAPAPAQFLDIALDWLVLGVVPGYAATTLPLDGGDAGFAEPF